jgi:hypothetical protein
MRVQKVQKELLHQRVQEVQQPYVGLHCTIPNGLTRHFNSRQLGERIIDRLAESSFDVLIFGGPSQRVNARDVFQAAVREEYVEPHRSPHLRQVIVSEEPFMAAVDVYCWKVLPWLRLANPFGGQRRDREEQGDEDGELKRSNSKAEAR